MSISQEAENAAGSSSQIYIGTSGWHYDHWQGTFYPENLNKSEFLDYYAGRFRTAEINNSFYNLPEEKTLADWQDRVPEGFVFSAKASRYLTHMKKLKEPEDPLQTLLGRLDTLGDRLGPILFQLPPNWRANAERLESFLEALPRGYRYVFEFRDGSWFDDRIYELLAEYEAALCVYDLGGETSPLEATADFVYLRLHGPDAAYQGRYGANRLSAWAKRLRGWLEEGRDVYCYFDNDEAAYAPQDALRLLQMLEG